MKNLMFQVFDTSHARIKAKSRWTQGFLARDGAGHRCAPDSCAAACWCSIGTLKRAEYGMWHVGNGADFAEARRAILQAFDDELKSRRWRKGLANYNDSRSHRSVMSVWAGARARLVAKYGEPE